MFLKFFLSYYDNDYAKYISTGNRQTASSHNNYKVIRTPTFNQLKIALANKLNRESQYNENIEYTREVLINVDDTSMFQLEALCVPEYSYCTYNLETNKIGFGNTQHNAYMASWSGDNQRTARSGGGFVSGNEQDYFFNYYQKLNKQENPFTFTCPNNFHPQVLNELQNYISYEKNHLFKQITTILEYEVPFIDDFFTAAVIKKDENLSYTGTTLQYNSVIKAFDFFMNDDKDIFDNSENHTSGLKIMGALCLRMMQLTNETF
jgi:hypothetical protein